MCCTLAIFPLPVSALLAVMEKVVAHLRSDHDFIAVLRERLCDVLLTQPVAIGIRRVKSVMPRSKALCIRASASPSV